MVVYNEMQLHLILISATLNFCDGKNYKSIQQSSVMWLNKMTEKEFITDTHLLHCHFFEGRSGGVAEMIMATVCGHLWVALLLCLIGQTAAFGKTRRPSLLLFLLVFPFRGHHRETSLSTYPQGVRGFLNSLKLHNIKQGLN